MNRNLVGIIFQFELLEKCTMKFCLVLVIFLSFRKVETSPQFSESKALQKAFIKVSESLSQQNHLVSVVLVKTSSVATKSAPFPFIAAIPHIVTFFDVTKSLRLNSSSIVLLDSFKTLEAFNKQTIPPQFFTTS